MVTYRVAWQNKIQRISSLHSAKGLVSHLLPLKNQVPLISMQEQQVLWIIGCKIRLVGQAWHQMAWGKWQKRQRKLRINPTLKTTNWRWVSLCMKSRLNASTNSHSAWVCRISIHLLKEILSQKQWAQMLTGVDYLLVTSHHKRRKKT